VSACRSCHAPVKWARTEAGKNMPLDVGADGELLVVPDGNVVVTGWAGPLRLVRVVAAGEGQHRSHFASCPNAKAHRR
jgi:hypothetical protein